MIDTEKKQKLKKKQKHYCEEWNVNNVEVYIQQKL